MTKFTDNIRVLLDVADALGNDHAVSNDQVRELLDVYDLWRKTAIRAADALEEVYRQRSTIGDATHIEHISVLSEDAS